MVKIMTALLLATTMAAPLMAQDRPDGQRWQHRQDGGQRPDGAQPQDRGRWQGRDDAQRAQVDADRARADADRARVQGDRARIEADRARGGQFDQRPDNRRFDGRPGDNRRFDDQRRGDDRRFDNGRPGDDRRWDNRGRGDDRRWDNDRRDDRRWDNGRPGNDHRWDDRRDNGGWNRDWRQDRRYDWRGYRDQNRGQFRGPRFYAPRGYAYRRFSPGYRLDRYFFGQGFWISDPYAYRLPPAYGPYRWVRYYDDVVLVDVRTGLIQDVIYAFFR